MPMAQQEKKSLSLDSVRVVVVTLSSSRLPAIAEVAREVGTTRRTLQRCLAAAGTSYRELVAAARHDVAKALLRDTDAPVGEIAARLGYATPGAFSRAFVRRAHKSPRAWRLEAERGVPEDDL